MNKVVIYGIVDPISNQLRYVGQTSNFIKRKSSHIRTALKGTNNSHLYNWLSSLFRSSINPEFIIFEECNIKDLDDLEVFYIDYFKMIGCNLTNSCVGGNSRRGFKMRESSKKIVSEKLKGNSWNKGKKLSKETKDKMSISQLGRKHTKTSIEKMRLVKIKNKPIIQREKGGLYIKTFNSAYEASKELNINRKSIGNVLAKRAKLAGGFNWTYN